MKSLTHTNEIANKIIDQIKAVELYISKFNASRALEREKLLETIRGILNSANLMIKERDEITESIRKDNEEGILNEKAINKYDTDLNKSVVSQYDITDQMQQITEVMKHILKEEQSLSPEEIHNNAMYMYIYSLYESLLRSYESQPNDNISTIINNLFEINYVNESWKNCADTLRIIRNKCAHSNLEAIARKEEYHPYIGKLEENRYVIKNKTIQLLIEHVYEFIECRKNF